MKTYPHISIACMLCLLGASSEARSDDMTERLRSCAGIDEDAKRVACYENLGQEALATAEKPAVVNAIEKKPPGAKPVATAPEPVAASSAPTNVPFKGDRPVEEYPIVVSSCERNKNRDTYFILDNGEIWKQTGGKRIKEADCSFPATLRKDVFGYKMLVGAA
jgi:hypothetical protein